MYRTLLEKTDWHDLPMVGLFLFLAVFALVVVRVFAARTSADFDEVAALPLADGSPTDASEVKP